MPRHYKILFSGPVGAGKSTAIRALSDTRPVVTEAPATDETQHRKRLTTVAMDYGVLHLDDGAQVHLYGTPGQERFDFMWDILQEGALGLVLLIDNAASDPIEQLRFFVAEYRQLIDSTALAVGVTRSDIAPDPHVDSYWQALDDTGVNAPVFTVDARRRADLVLLLEALLFSLDPGVQV